MSLIFIVLSLFLFKWVICGAIFINNVVCQRLKVFPHKAPLSALWHLHVSYLWRQWICLRQSSCLVMFRKLLPKRLFIAVVCVSEFWLCIEARGCKTSKPNLSRLLYATSVLFCCRICCCVRNFVIVLSYIHSFVEILNIGVLCRPKRTKLTQDDLVRLSDALQKTFLLALALNVFPLLSRWWLPAPSTLDAWPRVPRID